MQNITAEKKPDFKEKRYDKTGAKEKNYKLSIKEIEKFYLAKNINESMLGLEYERLSLDKNTLDAASYDKVSKIIEHFAQISGWELVFDDETITGAKDSSGTSISLEPGCQLEISLAPEGNIVDIDSKASKIINLLDKISEIYDVCFLGYGINPKNPADEIPILNKRRYKIMNEYLPYCKNGELCPNMMRKTAGAQINIDFKDKKDAFLKLKFFNLISPFMTALYANSPHENNVLTDNKSNRAYAWLYTGENRCNLFYGGIFNLFFGKYKNIFKNYIKEILNVPMLYIVRNKEIVPIKGKINFAEFMKTGFEGHFATLDDYILHQSLCFPDVRLKNYIEIRNHDSADLETVLSLCAFYKGLSQADFSKLLKEFHFLKLEKVPEYSREIIKSGLDIKLDSKVSGWDVIAKLFNIAKNNLNSKERTYLKPVCRMLVNRKTAADILIEYDIKNASELVEFLS